MRHQEYWKRASPEVKERHRKRHLKWAKENREHLKHWRKKNPDKALAYHLKSYYGLSWERYQEMLIEQRGLCAICKEKETCPGKTRLSIDHDKITKKVRGLLCSDCNASLGLAKHNILILESAIEYLKRNQ